jgi:hypothetical protein
LSYFFHYIAKDWSSSIPGCIWGWEERGRYEFYFFREDQLRYRDFLVAFSSSSAWRRGRKKLVRQPSHFRTNIPTYPLYLRTAFMYSTHVLYTGAQDLGTVDILHKFIDAIYFKDVCMYVCTCILRVLSDESFRLFRIESGPVVRNRG